MKDTELSLLALTKTHVTLTFQKREKNAVPFLAAILDLELRG